MGFLVTEKAMRPASTRRECFYCGAPIGKEHGEDCVLVKRRSRVRVTLEYDIVAPADWDEYAIEFHRNDGSWCANNMIGELIALEEKLDAEGGGCLCPNARFEVTSQSSTVFLEEE